MLRKLVLLFAFLAFVLSAYNTYRLRDYKEVRDEAMCAHATVVKAKLGGH